MITKWTGFSQRYNMNTLWLRETVRQTSQEKSAAAGPIAAFYTVQTNKSKQK